MDLRQHVASLVSVFLALVVGILVGISLSRQESLEARMRDLTTEFRDIRQENVTLREQVKMAEKEREQRAGLEKSVLAALVGGQLDGARIALIYTDDAKRMEFECEPATVFMTAGASVISETVIGRDFEASLARMKPELAQQLDAASEVSAPLVAAKIGEWVAAGEQGALTALNSLASVQTASSYRGAPDAVVILACPREEDEARCQAVDLPLLESLVSKGALVTVGLGENVPAARAAAYRQKGVVVIEAANTIPGEVDLVGVLRAHLKEGSKTAG